MTKVDGWISNINESSNIFGASHQNIKMIPWNVVGFQSQQTTIFFIVLVILALEKGSHLEWSHKEILSSNQKSMEWSQAQLKVWWRTCQRSSNL